MGTAKEPQLVKVFSGIIAPTKELIEKSVTLLCKSLGKSDITSEVFPFKFTNYYSAEMGNTLLRAWVGFEKLIDPKELIQIKNFSNNIETEYCKDGNRTINLDPGYLALSKIILASTKDFSHRIYLSNGIYAEITVQYKNKTFSALPWTYPDYICPQAIKFFTQLRGIYHNQLQQINQK